MIDDQCRPSCLIVHPASTPTSESPLSRALPSLCHLAAYQAKQPAYYDLDEENPFETTFIDTSPPEYPAVFKVSVMFQDLDFLDKPTKPRKGNDHLWADDHDVSQFTWFPFNGESMTACEIMTFLPNWLREPDVVFRLASNGVSNATITDIVNHHRKSSLKGEVMNNTVCKLTQTAMRSVPDYEYPVTKMEDGKEVIEIELWSIHQHKIHNTKDCWGLWDHNSLAVGQVHYGNGNRVGRVPPISVDFKSLGDGVETFPSVDNGDGLDLTRCVQYAMEHKEEELKFPDDFSKICGKIGRTTVEKRHLDGPTFERWVKKRKDDKAAGRKAQKTAPSSGVSKATPSKVSKSGVADGKAKNQKLINKIKEAYENDLLVLAADGGLVLLKVEPVDPTAGLRTQSSAHHSPVDEHSHDSLADGQYALTDTQAADAPRRPQVATRARRAQAAGPHRQSQAADSHRASQADAPGDRSEVAAARRRHKINTRISVAGSNSNGVRTQTAPAVNGQQSPAPTFYEYSGVNASFSASGQHDGAQNLMQTFNDVWNRRRPAVEREIMYHENIFPNAPAPNGYTQSNVGREVPPLRFYPAPNGTNVLASYQKFIDGANDTVVGKDDIDPSFFAPHSPQMPTRDVAEDNLDASVPFGDAAQFQNVDPAYFGQDSVDAEPSLGWVSPTQSAEGAQYWSNAVYRGVINDTFDPADLRP